MCIICAIQAGEPLQIISQTLLILLPLLSIGILKYRKFGKSVSTKHKELFKKDRFSSKTKTK